MSYTRFVIGPFVFTITEIRGDSIANDAFRLSVKDRRTGAKRIVEEFETESGAAYGICLFLRDHTKSPRRPEWLSYEGFRTVAPKRLA